MATPDGRSDTADPSLLARMASIHGISVPPSQLGFTLGSNAEIRRTGRPHAFSSSKQRRLTKQHHHKRARPPETLRTASFQPPPPPPSWVGHLPLPQGPSLVPPRSPSSSGPSASSSFASAFASSFAPTIHVTHHVQPAPPQHHGGGFGAQQSSPFVSAAAPPRPAQAAYQPPPPPPPLQQPPSVFSSSPSAPAPTGAASPGIMAGGPSAALQHFLHHLVHPTQQQPFGFGPAAVHPPHVTTTSSSHHRSTPAVQQHVSFASVFSQAPAASSSAHAQAPPPQQQPQQQQGAFRFSVVSGPTPSTGPPAVYQFFTTTVPVSAPAASNKQHQQQWGAAATDGPRVRWECELRGGSDSSSSSGDGGDGGSGWVAYEDHISAQLEMAQREGRGSVRFATRGFLYEVDLARMTQTNTETGRVRSVRRLAEVQLDFVVEEEGHECRGSVVAWPFGDKGADRLVLYKEPERRVVDFSSTMERLRRDGHERDVSFWDNRHLACHIRGRHGDAAMVRVGFGTPEYLAVQEKFALVETVDSSSGQRTMAKHATLANSILSIFRLQNPTQMERYCLMRSSISSSLVKAGRNGTEQVLWHGPSSLQAMEGIVLRGFDRMYAHKGANAFGKGCYFARDLTIADRYACSVYSEVDGRVCQAVVLAKVLVGEYTLGVKDMYPPPMKPNSTDVYDATVNNLDNPSIFVTYQDNQAMPYYLVTYQSPFHKNNN